MSADRKSVDVLEVLDDAISEISDLRMTDRHGIGSELIDAYSAVAELIEAATLVRDATDGPDGVSVALYDRLTAALARVQGGAK